MGKRLSLLFAAAMLTLVFQTAMAGEDGRREDRGRGRHGMGMRMGRGGMRGMGMGLMGRLDFTPEQRNRMVDVLTENFRERLLARMEMSDAREKLRELRRAGTVDSDAIVAANEALGAARGKLDVLNRTFRDKMEAVLTPEQQKQLDSMRSGIRRHLDRWDDDDRDDMDDWDDDDDDWDDHRDRRDRGNRRHRWND